MVGTSDIRSCNVPCILHSNGNSRFKCHRLGKRRIVRDGWHLFGIGSSAYTEAADEFTSASDIVNGYIDAASEQGIDTDAVAEALDTESEDFDPAVAKAELAAFVEDVKNINEIEYTVVDEETMSDEEDTAT